MRLLIFILSTVFVAWSCISEQKKEKVGNNISVRDSENKSLNVTKGETDGNNFKTDLDTIIQQFTDAYRDTFKIDTVIWNNNKKYKIDFQHYCLFDSAVIVPEKYVSFFGMKKFITHKFESSLIVRANNDIIMDTIITKNIFDALLSNDLKNYGVLLYPNFSITNGGNINFDYSVSIPLTDIGTGVSIKTSLGKNIFEVLTQ